jgi:hypothetical protein
MQASQGRASQRVMHIVLLNKRPTLDVKAMARPIIAIIKAPHGHTGAGDGSQTVSHHFGPGVVEVEALASES